MSNQAEILWADFQDASNDCRTCRAQLLVLHDVLVDLRSSGADTVQTVRLLDAKRVELDLLKAIRDQSFNEIVDTIYRECEGRFPTGVPSPATAIV